MDKEESKTKIIRASWHSHTPIPVLFDFRNHRHLRRIDVFLDRMKRFGINCIAFTPHDFINIRNHKLYPKRYISIFRWNITTENLYDLFAERAHKKGIIALPGLELETSESWKTFPTQKIHLGAVHHDPKVIYNKSLYKPRPLKEILAAIPPETVVDLKHPWHHKYGAASFMDKGRLEEIIKKNNILIEKNGMGITTYYVYKGIYKTFPFLLKSKARRSRFLDLKYLVTLNGLARPGLTAGGDNHSIYPYPKGGGHIKLPFDRDAQITPEKILSKVKKGEGEIVIPTNLRWSKATTAIIKTLPALTAELLLEKIINNKKEKMRKEIKVLLSKEKLDINGITKLTYRLNEVDMKNLSPKALLSVIKNTYL